MYQKNNLSEIKDYAILFLAGLILLFMRSAYNVFVPSMYAEDGLWISYIINNGFFNTMIHIRGDYFVFGNIIFLQISLILNKIIDGNNLNNLPVYIACVQYCFFSLTALLPVICFKNDIRKLFRILIWFLIILVPIGHSGYEIFGKIVNTGYVFYFIAVCLLFVRIFKVSDLSKTKIVIIDAVLFLCCTTNPACYPLVGLSFILIIIMQYKDYKNDSRNFKNFFKYFFSSFSAKSWLVLGILCVVAAGYCIIFKESAIRSGDINYAATIEVLGRSLLFYVVYPFYNKLNDFMVMGLFLALVILFIFVCIRANKMQKLKLCFLVFVPIFYTVITFFGRPGLSVFFINYATTFPDRYYYGINIVTIIPIFYAISIIGGGKLFLKIITFVIAGYLFIIPFTKLGYLFQFTNPLVSFAQRIPLKQRIRDAYHNKSIDETTGHYLVSIDPEGWKVDVPEKYILASIFHVPQIDTLQAVSLTDSNWSDGVWRHGGNILLFPNSYLELLKNIKTLSSGNKVVNILEVKSMGAYVHVICDSHDLESFAYPNKSSFVLK